MLWPPPSLTGARGCGGAEAAGSASQWLAKPGSGPGMWGILASLSRSCPSLDQFCDVSQQNRSQECRTNITPVIYRKSTARALAVLPLKGKQVPTPLCCSLCSLYCFLAKQRHFGSGRGYPGLAYNFFLSAPVQSSCRQLYTNKHPNDVKRVSSLPPCTSLQLTVLLDFIEIKMSLSQSAAIQDFFLP